MGEMADVLITSKSVGKTTLPDVPKVAKAQGNVPTSEEFNVQVSAFNTLIDTLRSNGTIK